MKQRRRARSYGVLIRRKDGTDFLAHATGGVAAYGERGNAYRHSRELREHKFDSRVVILRPCPQACLCGYTVDRKAKP